MMDASNNDPPALALPPSVSVRNGLGVLDVWQEEVPVQHGSRHLNILVRFQSVCDNVRHGVTPTKEYRIALTCSDDPLFLYKSCVSADSYEQLVRYERLATPFNRFPAYVRDLIRAVSTHRSSMSDRGEESTSSSVNAEQDRSERYLVNILSLGEALAGDYPNEIEFLITCRQHGCVVQSKRLSLRFTLASDAEFKEHLYHVYRCVKDQVERLRSNTSRTNTELSTMKERHQSLQENCDWLRTQVQYMQNLLDASQNIQRHYERLLSHNDNRTVGGSGAASVLGLGDSLPPLTSTSVSTPQQQPQLPRVESNESALMMLPSSSTPLVEDNAAAGAGCSNGTPLIVSSTSAVVKCEPVATSTSTLQHDLLENVHSYVQHMEFQLNMVPGSSSAIETEREFEAVVVAEKHVEVNETARKTRSGGGGSSASVKRTLPHRGRPKRIAAKLQQPSTSKVTKRQQQSTSSKNTGQRPAAATSRQNYQDLMVDIVQALNQPSTSTDDSAMTQASNNSTANDWMSSVITLHSCAVCEAAVFATIEQLMQHLFDVHSETSKSWCLTCHATGDQTVPFKNVDDLSAHMNRHCQKRYTCSLCGHQANNHYSLRRHITGHTGERPYTCRVCHRTFRDLSTHRRHERTHTGERPYQCPICQRNIARRDNVKVHLQMCHFKNQPIPPEILAAAVISRSPI